MMGLHNRIALVTGGASGLGLATAQRLCKEGAQVIIADIDASAGASAAASMGAAFLLLDVTDEENWDEAIKFVEAEFQALHILVNNAGIIGPAEESDPEHGSIAAWRRIFAVNAEGAFLGCRSAIRAMRLAGGGAIINVASVAGITATPSSAAYGASKASLIHLTRSVAQYCAEQRLFVRCNSVQPGTVRTPLWDAYAEALAQTKGVSLCEVVEAETAEIPLGRMTTPDDVAAAIAFLASDDARQITGTHLVVDGGYVGCDGFARGALR